MPKPKKAKLKVAKPTAKTTKPAKNTVKTIILVVELQGSNK